MNCSFARASSSAGENMDRVSVSLGGDKTAVADSYAGAAAMMNPTDEKSNARNPKETPRRKREAWGEGETETAEARERERLISNKSTTDKRKC